MDYLDYRKRLGIGFNEKKLASLFLTRMKNLLGKLSSEGDYDDISDEEMLFNYCNTTGAVFEYMDSTYCLDSIIEDIVDADSVEEFLAKYTVLLTLFKNLSKDAWQVFWEVLRNCLTSTGIQFDIFEDDDGCFVFPKGASEMDAALVSQPLHWLFAYPKTRAAYIKALKEYSEANPSNASDVADKFRKTLETFLREFFNNNAPLEKNKAEYGRYLKARGVPSEITGNMETLLQAYANFMNGYAKHQDATSLNVLEYLMYQTGNIIRLLITLKSAGSDE